MVRVVQHENVARPHGIRVLPYHGLDAFAHGTQVHRHVRRIGNQVALRVEQRAAKVKPLLDVDRVSSVLQLQAHLFGNVHEQVVEDLQQHWVCRRSCCIFNSTSCMSDKDQVVKCCQFCGPAGLHDGGGVLLGDDGRAGDDVARAQVIAHHQGSVVPQPA